MRVALVTESYLPTVNGVTNSVVRTREHLRAAGHDTLVVAPDHAPAEPAAAPEDDDVVRIPSASLRRAGGFRVGLPLSRLTSTLRDFAPDVVHLASPIALGAHGAWAARRLDVPAVAVFQTDVAGFARSYGRRDLTHEALWTWLRVVHAGADLTLAPSRPTLYELGVRGIGPLALWPRGVDTEAFSPARRDVAWRRRHGIADDEVAVGYVGRLAAEKRLDELAVLSGMPGVRLVVVGDGPLRTALRRSLPGAVFTGHLDGPELSRAHASLDVFVHTGRHETFCQSAQEALASGVPVVAVRAGALPDLVRSGRTGLLVRPGSAAELREAVESYVVDPALRREHGETARLSVLGRSWARVGDALLDHYGRVLGGTPVAPDAQPVPAG